MLRMLHCYILPKITLHIEDLEKVNQALEKQLQHIQVLDCEVVNQCKAIDECMARLSDDRSRFLPDLEVIIDSYQCSKGFLDILMEDVKKEECKLRDEVGIVHVFVYNTVYFLWGSCIYFMSSRVKDFS